MAEIKLGRQGRIVIPVTRGLGLSLADRVCFALAASLEAPVVTADREWAKVDIGVEVRLVR